MTTQGDEDSPPPSQDSLCSLEGVPQGRFKLSDDDSSDEDRSDQGKRKKQKLSDDEKPPSQGLFLSVHIRSVIRRMPF